MSISIAGAPGRLLTLLDGGVIGRGDSGGRNGLGFIEHGLSFAGFSRIEFQITVVTVEAPSASIDAGWLQNKMSGAVGIATIGTAAWLRFDVRVCSAAKNSAR